MEVNEKLLMAEKYLNGTSGITKNVTKGMQLLKEVVGEGYLPAICFYINGYAKDDEILKFGELLYKNLDDDDLDNSAYDGARDKYCIAVTKCYESQPQETTNCLKFIREKMLGNYAAYCLAKLYLKMNIRSKYIELLKQAFGDGDKVGNWFLDEDLAAINEERGFIRGREKLLSLKREEDVDEIYINKCKISADMAMEIISSKLTDKDITKIVGKDMANGVNIEKIKLAYYQVRASTVELVSTRFRWVNEYKGDGNGHQSFEDERYTFKTVSFETNQNHPEIVVKAMDSETTTENLENCRFSLKKAPNNDGREIREMARIAADRLIWKEHAINPQETSITECKYDVDRIVYFYIPIYTYTICIGKKTITIKVSGVTGAVEIIGADKVHKNKFSWGAFFLLTFFTMFGGIIYAIYYGIRKALSK